MDDDEDDLYGTAEAEQNGVNQNQSASVTHNTQTANDEEEDSDDDVQFTLERPETAKTETASTTKQAIKTPADSSTSQPVKRARISAPPKQEPDEPQSMKEALTHNGKEGKDYPEVRTSTIDTDADPIWPADDKKITDVDIDADLAEQSKPWRLPGTDQTDFFNYGFDEYTWTQYCARQKSMTQTIGELKEEDARMKGMLGGMPSEGGMPDMMQMMQAMMGGGQGAPDPSKMDFNQFSQMMNMGGMGMPGMPAMPAMPGMNGPSGGFPGQQGSGSPMPQGGQGFQPPSGPSAVPGTMDYGQPEQTSGNRRGRRGRGGYNNF